MARPEYILISAVYKIKIFLNGSGMNIILWVLGNEKSGKHDHKPHYNRNKLRK